MHMQPTTTILLINSPHLNWGRLRALLAKQRHAQFVGEVHRRDEAVRGATASSPTSSIAGSDIPGIPNDLRGHWGFDGVPTRDMDG